MGTGLPSALALRTSLYSCAAGLSYLGLMGVAATSSMPCDFRNEAHLPFPPAFIRASWAGVQESMAMERTNEMCTPRDLRRGEERRGKYIMG